MNRVLGTLFILVLTGETLFATSKPVPSINQPLVPTSVAPGHSTFVLTVNGTGFVPGAVVKADGVPLQTKFVSSGTLEASIPAKAVAKAHSGAITVSNPDTGTSSIDERRDQPKLRRSQPWICRFNALISGNLLFIEISKVMKASRS